MVTIGRGMRGCQGSPPDLKQRTAFPVSLTSRGHWAKIPVGLVALVTEKIEKGSGGLFYKGLILSIFSLGVVAFFYFDLTQYLDLEKLQENKEALRHYTERHYATTVLIYIGIYCAQTALSVPGATILTLTGGFLFGTLLATLYVNVAATMGATLVFLAVRYLFRGTVERKSGERLQAIQRGISENAFSYLLTLRLIPAFPFFFVNMVSGLTRIRVGTYVVATSIGIVPAGLVYTNTGKQLGNIDSVGDIASTGVLVAFFLLGVLALTPVLYKKLRKLKDGPPAVDDT